MFILFGSTTSSNFPTTPNAFNRVYNGNNLSDVFISKFNRNLNLFLASTYLGGSDEDVGKSIDLDSLGNIYVAGTTRSNDFPVTLGVHDTNFNGNVDVFVSKLNNNLSTLLLSTYMGGTGFDGLNNVTTSIGKNDDVYVAGDTDSLNFPMLGLGFSTGISGGLDGFIVRLNKADFTIIVSTYLGGSNDDIISSMIIDNVSGDVIVGGSTDSTDFPTTAGVLDRTHNGNFDGFLAKLDHLLGVLRISTYLGSNGNDYVKKLSFLSSSDIIVAGETTSASFPVTLGSYDTTFNGVQDVFLTHIKSDFSSILASSFYGGNALDIILGCVVSSDDYIYLVGTTFSNNLPTVGISYDKLLNGLQDGFVIKFDKDITNRTGTINSSHSSFDFGSTIIRTTSLSQAFTIQNTGLGQLEVGIIRLTGSNTIDFQIIADGCSNTTLNSGATCDVTVRFAPKSTGTKSTTLQIPSTDPAKTFLNISLTGIGLPAVIVTSPNGGEVIPSGGTHLITWSASPGVTSVDLQYSLNNGFTWVNIVKNVSGTSYLWTVPVPKSNKKALIRVIGKSSAKAILGNDKSDRPFSIEVVRLTSPNGGEVFTSGDTPLTGITWIINATFVPVSGVKIQISFNNGFTWKTMATVIGNPNFYLWTVPAVIKTNTKCKIRVI